MDQIRSLIDSITVSDVITWALVVLVAGFIGQFGRKFAEHLIEKAKKNKQEPPREPGKRDTPEVQKTDTIPSPAGGDSPEETGSLPASPKNDKEAKEQSKLEKKAAKALIKQKKKATPSD